MLWVSLHFRTLKVRILKVLTLCQSVKVKQRYLSCFLSNGGKTVFKVSYKIVHYTMCTYTYLSTKVIGALSRWFKPKHILVCHVIVIGRFLNYIFWKFWKPIHFMGKIGLHYFKDTSLCVDKWSKEKMHFQNMSRGFGHNQWLFNKNIWEEPPKRGHSFDLGEEGKHQNEINPIPIIWRVSRIGN